MPRTANPELACSHAAQLSHQIFLKAICSTVLRSRGCKAKMLSFVSSLSRRRRQKALPPTHRWQAIRWSPTGTIQVSLRLLYAHERFRLRAEAYMLAPSSFRFTHASNSLFTTGSRSLNVSSRVPSRRRSRSTLRSQWYRGLVKEKACARSGWVMGSVHFRSFGEQLSRQ